MHEVHDEAEYCVLSVALLSGSVHDVECNRFGSVAELRCLLERKLHLSPLQGTRLFDDQGQPAWDHLSIEELRGRDNAAAALTAVVVKRPCFAAEAPEDFSCLSVEGFGNMCNRYMEISACGQFATNHKQEDSRAELLPVFGRQDLPVTLRVMMPDSDGYAHFLYVRSGDNVLALEANKRGLYSIYISQDIVELQSSAGPITKTFPSSINLDDNPLRCGVYLYRASVVELRTELNRSPSKSLQDRVDPNDSKGAVEDEAVEAVEAVEC